MDVFKPVDHPQVLSQFLNPYIIAPEKAPEKKEYRQMSQAHSSLGKGHIKGAGSLAKTRRIEEIGTVGMTAFKL